MRIDYALHNRQPQPGAAGTAGAVAAHKRLKQMLQLIGFNTGTIIINLEPGAVKLLAAADFDPAVTITRSRSRPRPLLPARY